MSSEGDRNIQYMQQVISWQPRLYAFALSLTGSADEADEVLQNTNVVLLEKEGMFRRDADFVLGPCRSPIWKCSGTVLRMSRPSGVSTMPCSISWRCGAEVGG